MSSMVGVGLPSSRIEKFQKAIADGQLLMMLGVPSLLVRLLAGIGTIGWMHYVR